MNRGLPPTVDGGDVEDRRGDEGGARWVLPSVLNMLKTRQNINLELKLPPLKS